MTFDKYIEHKKKAQERNETRCECNSCQDYRNEFFNFLAGNQKGDSQ